MMLTTYNLQPMSLLSISLLHIMVSEKEPRQAFMGQGHYGEVKGQIL